MSGFRKFRTGLHRRRRSIEAVELGLLSGAASRLAAEQPPPAHTSPPAPGSEMSAGREAIEIGPQPIAWLKPRRQEADN
jgi:hypothetical protein